VPVRLLPSAEVLTVAYLKASADVSALVGARIGTELYAGTDPAIWLSLVTGDERWRNHLVAPVLDIRCYGGTKAQADVLARTVHAVMHDMPGTHATGVVTDVATLTLPAWSPDDGFEPPRPRYLATYQLTLHTLPS
jgi:hypothetical protein